MNEIDIKPVNIASNFHAIADMMKGLHENEKVLHRKTANWEEIERPYMRHVIAMQEECDGLCLVAYSGREVAGFIFGYLIEPDDSRIEEYTGKELYVSDGYVYPAFRRKGIYKMLNDNLEQHFIDRGIKRIIRYTLVKNDNMRGFLAKAGYEPTRLVYEKWL